MTNQIQWTNALSTLPSLEAAVKEATDKIKKSLSAAPDLAIVFISSAYASEYSRLIPLILEQIPVPVSIGCGGAGIVGTDKDRVREIERGPALSITAACLPEVEIHPFHILGKEMPDLDSSPKAWMDLIGIPAYKQPQFIVLSDPFSSKITDLLEGLDFAYPGAVKIGGLASTSSIGHANGLFYHCEQYPKAENLLHEGTVGVALSGKIILETVVAQGCRPIGQTYRIVKSERNVILELSGANALDDNNSCSSSPLEVLQSIIQSLSEEDSQLASRSLFFGIANDEFKLQLGQRDFLIRNLIGVDPKTGAIAIGDRVRPGQRIQFHLRDARTSAEDLELLLRAERQEKDYLDRAVGALMFACLGRGETLYDKPNFDSELFGHYFKNLNLGGFFCNGEIGPVGGRTFLHGYTSAFAIFRQP